MFLFLLRPVGRRDLSAGPEQKQHTTQGFFFCSGPADRQGKEQRRWPAAAPPGRSLTHCGLGRPFRHCGPGRRCLPSGTVGVVFFFLLRPRPDAHSLTAGLGGDVVLCFFAAAPPGRSLTHCGLGRPFRQGPGGVLFFAAAPPNPASQ